MNTEEYVWELIDKWDNGIITKTEFIHRVIQEWMMNVAREEGE